MKPILTSPEIVFAPWTAGSIKFSDTFCTLDTVVCENCCMKMDVYRDLRFAFVLPQNPGNIMEHLSSFVRRSLHSPLAVSEVCHGTRMCVLVPRHRQVDPWLATKSRLMGL